MIVPGLVLIITTAGCSTTTSAPDPAPSPSPTGTTALAPPATTAGAGPSPTPTPSPSPEPTLPPPPPPTAPAPTTSGPLTAAALPRPAGWRPVARDGGAEEGFEGNGTWVHGKDPRYAARDLISIGCAPVSRSQYTDPTAALEGSYARAGRPGIGLVLQFASTADAAAFFDLYRTQVNACTDPAGPVLARTTTVPAGLIDRRTYPDGTWTEMASVTGRRATFVILSDPGHRISLAAAKRVLAQSAG